jgi:hypothetical protein
MNRIGSELIVDAKESFSSTSSNKARDLLSLLVRANLAQARDGQQQMSDKAILARTYTSAIVLALKTLHDVMRCDVMYDH